MIGVTIALLTVVEVIVAFLLIGVILIQESKSHGGIGLAGGAMTESVLGASAGNVLTKVTVILASLFLGITLILAIITGHRQPGKSVIEGAAVPAAATPTAPASDALPQVEKPAASEPTTVKEPQAVAVPVEAATPAVPAAGTVTPPAAAAQDDKAPEAQPRKTSSQGDGAKAQP